MRLLVGNGAVLDAARHDEEVALAELHVPVTQLDREPALENEEEVVGVRVRVPDELALDLADLDLVAVVVADDLRGEELVERGELVGEVDGVVQDYSAVSIWAFCSRPE